jgi:hypothetical protein
MVILRMHRSLGDEVAFTGFGREWLRAYPNEPLWLDISRPELLEGNHKLQKHRGRTIACVDSPCDEAGNFIRGWGHVHGIPIVDDSPWLWFVEDRKRQRRVVIDPWSGNPERRWPLDRWRALVAWLNERIETWEVGKSTADCHGSRRPPDRIGANVDLVDSTTIKQVANLIKASTLFIGNDSGLAHIAAGVGTPAVVLYGPNHWRSRAYSSTIPIQGDGRVERIGLDEVRRVVEGALG